MNPTELAQLATAVLNEYKAHDISTINVKHLTDVTDTIIVCTATSSRHARTLGDKLVRAAKDVGIKPLGLEGDDSNQWVLIDLADIVVHIMLAETRELYSLEKLWSFTETKREKNLS